MQADSASDDCNDERNEASWSSECCSAEWGLFLVLGMKPSMWKCKQHSVVIKDLSMRISKIDIERERERHKEFVIFQKETVTNDNEP